MRKNIGLTLLSSVLLLSACNVESPELLPCMCNPDADSTLGIFDCMCEPAKKKPVRKISYLQDTQKINYQSLIISDEQYKAYTLLHKSRDEYAPIKLENVDFRIKKNRKYDEYNTKLGDYRFRIFGCRRETKNAYLNQGRSMQKDMHFFDVFYETMNDYYPVVVEPSNVYYPDSDKVQHEYVITAEITDYFMNICDEFDWNEAKNKKLRNGTSEMTVIWRVMNLAKDEVYCKGTTTGYGQIMEGEPNGETLLVERAFEDALVKLPEISCINQTLSQRLCAEDLEYQLAKLHMSENCEDCFASEFAGELKAIELLQECDEKQAVEKTVAQTTPVSCSGSACTSVMALTEGGTSSSSMTEAISEMVGGTAGNANISTITVAEECKNAEIAEECGEFEECHTNIEPQTAINVADDIFVDIPLEVDTAEAVDIIEDGGTTALSNVVDIAAMEEQTSTPLPQDNVDIEKVGEDSYANVKSSFCILNNPPFENLDPYNLYKLRTSIVSVENSKGQKGAGLVIADNMVLTSADLITKDNNRYNLETLHGKKFKGSAFRINPNKNVAVLLLDTPTEHQPLPLSLKLPEVNRDILLTLGMLNFDESGENYIDNEGRVVGYRWSDDKGAEIIVDTFVQTVTLGGALIDQKGNIIGIAHKVKKDDTTPDLFIPIETALRALGLDICGQRPLVSASIPAKAAPGNYNSAGYTSAKPKAVRVYTPIADAIDNSKADKSPKPLNRREAK